MTVGDQVKVLEKALDKLKAQDQNVGVGHVLCPDSGYQGDMENGFHTVEVVEEGDLIVMYFSYE